MGEKHTPIPMILFCPACGLQHIDEPEPSLGKRFLDPGAKEWDNPPHRSHLCAGCGHIWRPADVPTEGVAALSTVGRADAPAIRGRACAADPVTADLLEALSEARPILNGYARDWQGGVLSDDDAELIRMIDAAILKAQPRPKADPKGGRVDG